MQLIWVFGKSEYFFKTGLTEQINLNRLTNLVFTCKSAFPSFRGIAKR
jgi:hypothetical protein